MARAALQARLGGVGGVGAGGAPPGAAPAAGRREAAGVLHDGAKLFGLNQDAATRLDRVFTIAQDGAAEDEVAMAFDTQTYGAGFSLGAYSGVGAGLAEGGLGDLQGHMTGGVGIFAGLPK